MELILQNETLKKWKEQKNQTKNDISIFKLND